MVSLSWDKFYEVDQLSFYTSYFQVAEKDAFIIFTNPDRVVPYTANVSLPANGAIMGFFKMCLGLENPIVTGKPNPFLFDVIRPVTLLLKIIRSVICMWQLQ